MPRVIYQATPNVRFETDVQSQKGAFDFIARVQEIFTHNVCGCCQTPDARFVAREYDGFKYYRMECVNPACLAQFDFGQYKEGNGLFTKTWDKEKKEPLPDGGWHIYVPSSGGGSGRGDDGFGGGGPQQQQSNQQQQNRPQQNQQQNRQQQNTNRPPQQNAAPNSGYNQNQYNQPPDDGNYPAGEDIPF